MSLYLIVIGEPTQDQVNKSNGVAIKDLRSNADKSKYVLKYTGDKPTIFDGLTIYTKEEIKEELRKAEWQIEGT